MAKRGRKGKSTGFLGTADPKVVREIIGVVVLLISIILILSEFGLAGKFGATIFSGLKDFFGIVSYFVPAWLAFATVMFLKSEITTTTKKFFWGLFAFLILLSALVAPFGGSGGRLGGAIFGALSSVIGEIASLFIVIAALLITVILMFNLSLIELFKNTREKLRDHHLYPTMRGGVSVFRTVRRRMGIGRGKDEAPMVQPTLAGMDGAWQFPTPELLEESSGKAQPGNIQKNMDIIMKTLADFGIESSAAMANVGPTVTQYELKPAEGVKLSNIKARSDDLALALAAHPVRVEAPIPGKSAVGVEVPNKVAARVALRQIIESEDFTKRKSNLTIPLGIDVAGKTMLADLDKMPHLLVAGATGSGKSVALNAMALTMLYQNSPRDLRLLLVDPKRVEFTMYNGIPHLYTPVVVEVDKTVNLLRWAIAEMERRFKLFEKLSSRDITSYNEKTKKGLKGEDGTFHEKLPYIVIMIDELADLMAQAANEVEAAIVRLSQLARATGIHLIVATQRPSVDVITGLIKANITSRIAFAVASQADSRTILDLSGADKLLGNGDMLFIGGEYTKPKRIQGAFVSEKDVKAVTDFLKSEGTAVYDNSITEYREVSGIPTKGRRGLSGAVHDEGDELLADAKRLVVESGVASASFLQRRLKVGYARAARLLDLMEEQGIVGPSHGAKPRDILVDTLDYTDENSNQFQGPQV